MLITKEPNIFFKRYNKHLISLKIALAYSHINKF
jgi:hypothetical protein